MAGAAVQDVQWPIPAYEKEPAGIRRQYVRYHVQPLIQQALQAIAEESYAAADARLTEAARIDPGNNHVKLLLIRNGDRVGQYTRTVALCKDLLARHPEMLDLYFDQAYAAIKGGQDAEAIAALEALLRRAPSGFSRHVEALRVLAEASVRLGRFEEAARYADLWLARDKDPRARIVVAESLSRQGKPAEALTLLDEALGAARTPEQQAAIQLKRGYLLTGLKRFRDANEALREADRLVKADPATQAAIGRQMGMNALQLGEHAAAVELFKDSLQREFDESVALSSLEARMALRDWSALSEQARDLRAGNRLSLAGRQKVLKYLMFARKHLGDDIGYHDAAVQLARDGAQADVKEAGMAAARLRKHEEAAGYFRRSIEMAFDEATAAHYLEMLQEASRWNEAAEAAQGILKRNDLSADGRRQVLRVLMYAQKHRGNNAGYQAAANELLKSGPLAADLREAALAAQRMGQVEESIRLYRESLAKEYSESGAMAYLDALMDGNQWQEAGQEADRLLKRPDPGAALRGKALRCLMFSRKNLGDHEGFLAAARELIKAEGSREAYAEAALAAWRGQKLDESARYYEKALATGFDPAVALNFAFVLKLQEKTGEQEALLMRILGSAGVPDDVRRAARYELAQIQLRARRIKEYLETMDVVVQEDPEPSRLREFASQLYLSGESKRANEMFAGSLANEKDPARKYDLCMAVAELLLAVGQYGEARYWFNEACRHGSPDERWARQMGRADYELGDFAAAAERLAKMPGADDLSHLYAGFAFSRMELPGLALHHLDMIADPRRLGAAEQHAFFANRAYLNHDQGQYEAGLKDADAALALQDGPELRLVRMRILLALGRAAEVEQAGRELIRATTNVATKVEALDLTGRALGAQGGGAEAVRMFTRALELAPARHELYYLRAMAARKAGKPEAAAEDLRIYAERVKTVPAVMIADQGVTEGLIHEYDAGSEHLRKALGFFPYEVDTVEELGYQRLRANDARAARDAFRQAVDIYDEVIPLLEADEAKAYEEARLAMKQEFTKVDKGWGGQAYFNKTDYDLPASEALVSIDGALPSQYGAEFSWRPPRIGFRNERILEAFGRFLGNFEPDSWSPDEESYQGGVGVRYKPFATLNYNTSFERLFKIGDDAEDNWLWRNMLSVERKTKPQRDEAWWISDSLYGELSYYLEDPDRWIYYLDGRVGPAFAIGSRRMLTIPDFMAVGRYQSSDPTGLGSYVLVGFGAKARLMEGQKTYTVERWYADLFAYYTWGWFDDRPEGFAERSFEGIMFGVNLVR